MENAASYLSIDVGSSQSGIVVVNSLKIAFAANLENSDILKRIVVEKLKDPLLFVLIEDIKPYSVKLTQQTIDTCKFIGQLCYFLKLRKIKYELITRHKVKKWIYDSYPDIVIGLVMKKIEYRNKTNKDGKNRRPSYIYVDDRIIAVVMRSIWGIASGSGKRNSYGLSSHSWQALSIATYFLYSRDSH